MGEGGGARRFGWWSVRTRIIAVITIASAVGMLAVGVVVYVVERARILSSIDDRLEAGLDSARYIIAAGEGEQRTPWSSSRGALSAVMTRMSPDDNTGALGIVDGAAALIPGIVHDLDMQEPAEFAPFAAARAKEGPVIGTYAEHGVTWRYLAVPITIEGSPPSGEVVFTMAYDLDAELAEIDTPARIYLIAAGIATVIVAVAAGLVATRLLRPLRRMRDTAERVSAQSLSERLPVEGRDDVSELAVTMNEMFDRLDETLDSQRRLLSDVGHELKTPITIVRGHLEVMDADDPADVRGTRDLVVDELARMGRLVQDLSSAAALHGPAPIAPRQVDAADLLAQIVRKAEGIEGARVTSGGFADVTAELDPARITQAMLQLAQNGVTHGGGRLVIGSRVRDDALELWVRDFGPGVPDAAKTRIFDRFLRAGPTGRGSGLGLNIVQVIARAHGGTALVRDAAGGGAEFVLVLPRTRKRPAEATSRTVRVDGRELTLPPKPPLPTTESRRSASTRPASGPSGEKG